jgi:putative proteasome-type protease
MTYCLGILLPGGLVLAADSRSDAGVDQITRVHKVSLFDKPEERVIAILGAGNLATTQAVVTSLREALGSGDLRYDLHTARTMFEAANILGGKLREVIDHDGSYVQPYGDAAAGFLIGGQIAGENPRLFEIYSAGNFIEASDRKCFLHRRNQIRQADPRSRPDHESPDRPGHQIGAAFLRRHHPQQSLGRHAN